MKRFALLLWLLPSLCLAEWPVLRQVSVTNQDLALSGTNSIKITDGTTVAKVDSTVSAIRYIDPFHAHIHTGKCWEFGIFSLSVADDEALSFTFKTGTSERSHLRISAAASGDAIFYLYEGVTTNSFGTAATIVNMNRDTTNTTTAVAYTGVGTNVTNYGTALVPGVLMPGGRGNFAGGSSAESSVEHYLKTNTLYFCVVTNIAGAAKPMSLYGLYYK